MLAYFYILLNLLHILKSIEMHMKRNALKISPISQEKYMGLIKVNFCRRHIFHSSKIESENLYSMSIIINRRKPIRYRGEGKLTSLFSPPHASPSPPPPLCLLEVLNRAHFMLGLIENFLNAPLISESLRL